MGAPRNALRAFNAGVSLSCLRILAHRLPHLFCGLVLSLTCLVGVPSCGLATDFMAHRPTGSTQTDRIRLPYAARRLSLSRWVQSPASAKVERVSRLPSARVERVRRASRPGSVGFPDSVSCGYPRTHEGFRPCHRGYGYTGGSYSRRSTAVLAPWTRCHRRRPHGSPKRAAGPFPCGWALSSSPASFRHQRRQCFAQLLQRLRPVPLNGAPGHPNEIADLTVCQVQSAVQNQNALLCLRQCGESLGHKLVVDM